MVRKKKTENDEQVSFNSIMDVDNTEQKVSKKKNLKSKDNSKQKKIKPKKDRKINITQEDIDKLCEVYDWYLIVKDSFKINNLPEDKIIIEDRELKDTKKAYMSIDRETWEKFEIVCSNMGYKKNELLTQIIKDFLKEHRDMV